MKLFKRASELLKANINHLLDQAEDPEVMIKQVIRDMEAGIIDMRRETVKSVARAKQLEKQIIASEDLAKDFANKARLALEKDDEAIAKRILAKKLQTEERKSSLEDELKNVHAASEQLKEDLVKLEDQVQAARRKKEELIRRKRVAESKMRTQETKRKTIDALTTATNSILGMEAQAKDLETYEESIQKLEAEAEAAEEIMATEKNDVAELEKLEKDQKVEDELAQLKKQLSK